MILHRTDRLYWVDSQLNQIGHIDIQGSNRQTFTNIGEITQPYSLTVYTGGFYNDRIVFFTLAHPDCTAVVKNRILVIAKIKFNFMFRFLLFLPK